MDDVYRLQLACGAVADDAAEGDLGPIGRPPRNLLNTKRRRERPPMPAVGRDGGDVYAGVISEVERDPSAVRGPVRKPRDVRGETHLVRSVSVGRPQAGAADGEVDSPESDRAICRRPVSGTAPWVVRRGGRSDANEA